MSLERNIYLQSSSLLRRFGLWNCMVVLCIVGGAFIFANVWFAQIDAELGWHNAYQDVTTLENHCLGGTGQWRSGASFSDVFREPPILRNFPVPYRGKVEFQNLNDRSFLYISCDIDFAAVAAKESKPNFGWLNMGPVFGDSQLFVNGDLRSAQSDGSFMQIPLLPSDFKKVASVVLISKNTSENRPGPASLLPAFVTCDRAKLERLMRSAISWRTEDPLFRIGYDLSLLLLFSLPWLLGIRHAGLSWMIVLTFSLLFKEVCIFSPPSFLKPDITYRLESIAHFAAALAASGFILNIAGVPNLLRRCKWEHIFTSLMSLIVTIVLVLPDDIYWDYQVYIGLPSQFAVVVLGIGIILAWRSVGKSDSNLVARRSRLYTFLVTTTVALIVYIIQCVIVKDTGIMLSAFSLQLLTTLFALYIAIDFVIYQREYLREKELRTEAERLHSIDRAVANYTRMLAHDVRGPMRMAESYLSDLSSDDDYPTLKRKINYYAEQLQQNIKSVEATMRDVMESGAHAAIKTEPSSLSEIVQAQLANFAAHTRVKNLKWKFHLQHQFQPLINASRLERLINNLVSNAVSATKIGGTIELRSWLKDHITLHLVVKNSDSYVPPKQRDSIFAPYVTSGKEDGTGLGLVIVKDIVDTAYGKVWCDSDVNSGTEFHVEIPISHLNDVDFEFVVINETSNLPKQSIKQNLIMIVDDNPFVLESWTNHVDDAELITASSPEEALQLYAAIPRSQKLSAIITDLRFSNSTAFDGYMLREEFRRLGYRGPIFLMSNDSGTTIDGTDMYAAVLPKRPHDFAELKGIRTGLE